jgi:hypothetical protein
MAKRKSSLRAAGCLILLPLLIVAGLFGFSSYETYKTLPPLLRGLRARGGWASACPPPIPLDPAAYADATELENRLRRQFPVGTKEGIFVAELKSLGFEQERNCKDMPSIRMARFEQHAPILVTLSATVFWEADSGKRIRWIRAFVSYTGP